MVDLEASDVSAVSRQELSDFVALCASQLQSALEESNTEMDGLAVAALKPGETASADLVTRLQSVDRLMQRLSNVQVNLVQLADFMASESSTEEFADWSALLLRARGTYTMEQERNMFDKAFGSSHSECSSNADEPILFDDMEHQA